MKSKASSKPLSIVLALAVLIAFSTVSSAGEPEDLAAQANKDFVSGKSEAAKALYLKAAAMGSADAHYWFAMRFPLTHKERIHHFSEAAKRGHAQALNAALDLLLFQANSLTQADPQAALDLYNEVKKANPDLKNGFYGEQGVRVMKMCAEAKGFDGRQFMKKYNTKETGQDAGVGPLQSYYIWELAEEASKGGRFGRPDPELVFNLVIRGGRVPAEFMSAVEEAYGNWKKGRAKEFDLCRFVTSGYGMNYCALRKADDGQGEENAKSSALRAKLPKKARPLFDKAEGAAEKFFEERAENEEGYGCGSAHIAMVLSSKEEQMEEFVTLTKKVLRKKFIPSPKATLQAADEKLNTIYRDVMEALRKAKDNCACIPTGDEIKSGQRRWIAYRDAATRLFTTINPATNETTWKTWFTAQRCEQLESVREMISDKCP